MRNVYLIGPRASGKSTLGAYLADRLGARFVDTDDMVINQSKVCISALVEDKGWEAFRDLETRALAEVARSEGLVAATGGGIVLRPENRALLSRGLVVYLKAEAGLLADRLRLDPKARQRPSLTGADPSDEIAQVLKQREPLYLECADLVLDAAKPLEELAAAVIARMQEVDNER